MIKNTYKSKTGVIHKELDGHIRYTKVKTLVFMNNDFKYLN